MYACSHAGNAANRAASDLYGSAYSPFIDHGAVVAFDFSIGLRPVGAGELVLDPGAERLSKRAGPVAGAVIGEHAQDSDPVTREEGVRSFPEPGSGLFAFIGDDLGIGQPRMVINGVVCR